MSSCEGGDAVRLEALRDAMTDLAYIREVVDLARCARSDKEEWRVTLERWAASCVCVVAGCHGWVTGWHAQCVTLRPML